MADTKIMGYEGILEMLENGALMLSTSSGWEVKLDKPELIGGLQPPAEVRAVLTIDGTPFSITVRPAISDKAQQLLDQVRQFDGMEVHKEQSVEEMQELVAAGLVDEGPYRGPDRAWRRVVLKGEKIT